MSSLQQCRRKKYSRHLFKNGEEGFIQGGRPHRADRIMATVNAVEERAWAQVVKMTRKSGNSIAKEQGDGVDAVSGWELRIALGLDLGWW